MWNFFRGPPIVKVACGGDFSMILDAEGGLHSFGLPENGQLGNCLINFIMDVNSGRGFKSHSSLKW